MAKKEKRISINKLEQIVAPACTTVPLDGAPDVEIAIKRTLPLGDVLQFIANVVSACVDASRGEYTPEVLPFAMKYNVLTMYANFSLPANVEKQYDLIYNTTAVQQVMEHINMEQYEEIMSAINQRIKYELDMMTGAAVRQVNELTKKMEDFVAKSEYLFSDVIGEDLSSVMKNLATLGKMDERELVHAVLETQKERAVDAGEADNGLKEKADDKIFAFPSSGKVGSEL